MLLKEVLVKMLWMVSFVVLAVLVIVAVITFINWRRRKARIKRAEAESHEKMFRPDGLPYPPTGRGMCDACERAFEKVYYLPTGRRLCPECYETHEIKGPNGEPI